MWNLSYFYSIKIQYRPWNKSTFINVIIKLTCFWSSPSTRGSDTSPFMCAKLSASKGEHEISVFYDPKDKENSLLVNKKKQLEDVVTALKAENKNLKSDFACKASRISGSAITCVCHK